MNVAFARSPRSEESEGAPPLFRDAAPSSRLGRLAPWRLTPSALLCQLKCSACERSGIASQDRDIDRLRPAVGHVVVDIAATHQRDKSPAALLDGAGLSASHSAVPRLPVYGE